MAELQVTGVHSVLSKKTGAVDFSLTIHGLLLVDAMQTYGPDFELLMASHKNVWYV